MCPVTGGYRTIFKTNGFTRTNFILIRDRIFGRRYKNKSKRTRTPAL